MQTHMTAAQAACPNHIRHFSCYRRSSERLTYAGAVMAALGSASCLIWLTELEASAYRPSVCPYFVADFGNREWVWASNLLAHEESTFRFYIALTRTYSHYQGQK